MSHDHGAEGSDSAVYPELARANLLRMRGDYKAAEQQCLTILRRYPNNATANILLGDICAEKGDLDQSMQWYEMALDLTPESQAAQHKLESVKQRFKEKETAATVEQLGLPTTKSKAGIYAIALIAAVFIFAVAMYLAGQRVQQKADSTWMPTVKPHTNYPPGPPVDKIYSPTPSDSDLVDLIKSGGPEGGRVFAAMEDPRTGAITVSYTVLANEDPKSLGGFVARQTFEATKAPVVTIRGVTQDRTIFMANATRALYEETLAASWTDSHQSDPNAWIDHILSSIWPNSTDTTSKPSPPFTPPANDPTAPPGDTAASTTGESASTASDAGGTAVKDDGTKPTDTGSSPDQSGDGTPKDQSGQDNNGPPGDNTDAGAGTTTGL